MLLAFPQMSQSVTYIQILSASFLHLPTTDTALRAERSGCNGPQTYPKLLSLERIPCLVLSSEW